MDHIQTKKLFLTTPHLQIHILPNGLVSKSRLDSRNFVEGILKGQFMAWNKNFHILSEVQGE